MLLTFQELCTFLKADEAVVLSLIESGNLPPPLNIGDRLIRWVESDLARWVQMGCPKFPPPTSVEIVLIRAKYVEEKYSIADDADASSNEARERGRRPDGSR